MEYVEGQTLREILHDGRKILPERALSITADVLSALDYSHRSGIIHRDIKPANVMLTPSGQVKVMDFGIARAIADSSSAMTQTAAVIGTAQYLSPEQARGETVDARSDIYSTGCLLYELLTGRPPFVGESPVSVAYQHVREEARPPSQLNPDVSGTVDNIVAKSLAKRTDDRYQSAADMRKDIERAIAGQQVDAPAAATQLGGTAVGMGRSPDSAVARRHPGRRHPGRRHARRRAPSGRRRGARGRQPQVVGLRHPRRPPARRPRLRHLQADPARRRRRRSRSPTSWARTSRRRSAPSRTTASRSPTRSRRPAPTSRREPSSPRIPKAGDEADKGSEVTLTVSSGPGEVTIPQLTGFQFSEAKALLESDKYGLKVKRNNQESSAPENEVINSNPPGGTEVDKGSTVTLLVSQGSGHRAATLVGMDVDDAEDALKDAGLKSSTTEEPSPQPEGIVTAQSVPQGQQRPRGSTIELTVSSGPDDGDGDSSTATPTRAAPTAGSRLRLRRRR